MKRKFWPGLAGLFLLWLPLFSHAAPKPSKKDRLVTISTRLGEMKLILFDQTPKHKANFLKLAKEGFYNGTTFHRVINNFMIQGGDANSKDTDPYNDGTGDIGYRIPAEIWPTLKHVRGSVAAARNNNPQKESSGSQFYIVENHNGTPHLDNNYTVFGQVISGLEVIDKIAEEPKEMMDRPTTPIPMTVKVEKLKKKKITKLYGYAYGS
ncbi:peptidylprolyl isomerase [Adhaeribacter aquaticus]|uniref:peptidylprolyl isomerase n=1 Tax=Adhaeribacter aquaticus TaxID=299567 RepID=UPI000479D696|nr:peptidylprolyl isomerase [Adhaeribacter aquaticus]